MRGLVALVPLLFCACGSTLDSLGGTSNAEVVLPATPNAFRDVLGVTDAEITTRIEGAYAALFHGDPATQAVLREVGDGSSYILDVAEQDIGLDGMGYGLMISVQLDKRTDFDALWQFTQGRMLVREGPNAGYYSRGCNTSFQCTTETSPDASEFLATALIFADMRWGSTTTQDYAGAARALLDTMLTKEEPNGVVEGVTNMFDDARHLVVLAPLGDAAELTQPSYMMPAFYEVWAHFQPERAPRWRQIAAASRTFLRGVAHASTGLVPRITALDGTLGTGEGEAYYDWEAARTAMHLALDRVWFGGATWQPAQATRLLGFLRGQGIDSYVDQYTLDGAPIGSSHSTSMVAMNGYAALIVPPETGRDFVAEVWELEVPQGVWRYYDGMLYLLSLLGLSGNLRVSF